MRPPRERLAVDNRDDFNGLPPLPTHAKAWVSPLRYGSQVTFPKPVQPKQWDDDTEWYCEPLFTADQMRRYALATLVKALPELRIIGNGPDGKHELDIYGYSAANGMRLVLVNLPNATITNPSPHVDT